MRIYEELFNKKIEYLDFIIKAKQDWRLDEVDRLKKRMIKECYLQTDIEKGSVNK